MKAYTFLKNQVMAMHHRLCLFVFTFHQYRGRMVVYGSELPNTVLYQIGKKYIHIVVLRRSFVDWKRISSFRHDELYLKIRRRNRMFESCAIHEGKVINVAFIFRHDVIDERLKQAPPGSQSRMTLHYVSLIAPVVYLVIFITLFVIFG